MRKLKFEGIDGTTRELIKYQIGRKPANLLGIVAYCPFDQPAVLLTHPYQQGKGVFPTTYWLSCPDLVRQISRLEGEGMIRELTELLERDQGFRTKMARAHRDYAKLRYSLLAERERAIIGSNSPKLLDILRNSGVAGIVDQKGIKCLHAHLADYLVTGKNPAGKIIEEMLNWPEQCQICQIGVDHR